MSQHSMDRLKSFLMAIFNVTIIQKKEIATVLLTSKEGKCLGAAIPPIPTALRKKELYICFASKSLKRPNSSAFQELGHPTLLLSATQFSFSRLHLPISFSLSIFSPSTTGPVILIEDAPTQKLLPQGCNFHVRCISFSTGQSLIYVSVC